MEFFIFIGCIAIILAFVVLSYNGLVRIRNQVRNAWQQIDIQLKRRHDLIPNLVASVKGYMQHEQGTLEHVTQARAAAVNAGTLHEKIAKENDLTSALSKLVATVESYPELKANETIQPLMEQLTTTENQISFARQFFNDLATTYNTKLEIFPTNLYAASFGFHAVPLFQITEAKERDVPAVDFSSK
jgi:LemA protein